MMFIKKFFFTLLITLPLFTTTTPTVKQTNAIILTSADEVPDYDLNLGDELKTPRTILSVKVI